MSQKNRIESIDMAKGLLMILVVIFHITALTITGAIILIPIGAGTLISYFALSGYTYSAGKRSYMENIVRRIKQLIIPYIIFFIGIFIYAFVIAIQIGIVNNFMEALSYLPSLIMDKVNVTSFYGETTFDFRFLFYTATAPMWFLTSMLFSGLIFDAIAGFAEKSNSVCCLIIVGLLAVSVILKFLIPECIFFNIQDAPAFAGIMYTGLVLRKQRLLETRKIRGLWLPLSAILLFVVGVICLMYIGLPYSLSEGNWGKFGGYSVFPGYAIGILYLFMYVYICDALKDITVVNKALTCIGRNTLQILLIHCPIGLVILLSTGLLTAKSNPTNKAMLITFFLSFVVVALSTLYALGLKEIKKRLAKKQ